MTTRVPRDLDEVEPARRLEERRRERPQALADVVEVGARAQAAAAAASELATFIRARPPNVPGMRCVYSTGILRGPCLRTMSSPWGVSSRQNAALPRDVWPSTRSKPSSPFCLAIENRTTRPAQWRPIR